MNEPLQLIYVLDPMCSWCWGFQPVWQQIEQWAKPRMPVRYLLGGLAPDTDEPMPQTMRQQIQNHWRRIEQQIPGTRFNHDFWTSCQPRRATYPACRAVVAARGIDPAMEIPMIRAIQRAYYLQAKNPSEVEVLHELATALGIDSDLFRTVLEAERSQIQLLEEIRQARAWGVRSFPTVLLQKDEKILVVGLNYQDSQPMVREITRLSDG